MKSSTKSKRKFDFEEIAARVEQEGGVYELILAGVTHTEINDPPLSAAWKRAEEAMSAFDDIAALINERNEIVRSKEFLDND